MKPEKSVYDQIWPAEQQGFINMPGVYCRHCSQVFALYEFSIDQPDGMDDQGKPYYDRCRLCTPDPYFGKSDFKVENSVISYNGVDLLKLEGDWTVEITTGDGYIFYHRPNVTYRTEWAFAVSLIFLIVLVIWSL